MTDDRWIIIPDWDRFQSYAAERPAWIKLWTDLNSNEKWVELPVSARGTLTTIWAEYARSAGRLRARSVMQLCGKSARSSHLTSLEQAGFIEFSSSKPESLSRARASVRSQEKTREEETPKVSSSSTGNGKPPPAAKKAATAKGTNLTQNSLVADRILEPYRQAARWMKHDGWRYDDWRFRIETEYGISDDVELAALENIREQAAAEAGLR